MTSTRFKIKLFKTPLTLTTRLENAGGNIKREIYILKLSQINPPAGNQRADQICNDKKTILNLTLTIGRI